MSDAQVQANVLRALAAAPDLVNQPMTTTTVYGVVTLSGSVATDALRDEAEKIVSTTRGVKKVVDEMTVGPANVSAAPADEPGAPADEPGALATDAQDVNAAQPAYGGQEAGEIVVVPGGALLRMRINQTLDSSRAEPGDHFDGVLVNDVVAGGAVAIPRGASVEGVVVAAKKSGALSGRGELTLQLTQVTLGGRIYPVVTDDWARNGGDKTVETVNKTAAGGAIGALFGAAAGGGTGAAIGAGIGGALGLGSAAASRRGQVYVPSEGLLSFRLARPVTVATVSQAEMNRLSRGVPGVGPRQLQRRPPPAYYGPGYYRPYP